jgi:hypothetical protein
MNKQLTILLLLFFTCTFICAQKWIKTTSPCNDELLKNVQGEWIHWGDPWYAKLSKQQELEVRNRVATIHQFVFNLTPTLSGIDAAWGIHSADYEFAQQARTEHLQGGQSRVNYYNGIPLVQYTYSVGFFEYSCGRSGVPNEMRKGYPREDGASLSVSVNTLNKFLLRDYGGVEGVQVDGRNIKMMPPVTGTWKDYTMYDTETSSFSILLHRDGMLPYIPVTRKQYLELAMRYFNKFYDDNIKAYDDMGALIDKKQKDENIKTQQKLRDDILKYYKDELAATITAGLLDSPAIVLNFLSPLTNYPIFIRDNEGGNMLVTENPAYFRKDLPKYIPQLFILSISRMDWWFIPKIDPITVLEEKFPIEKLQAMIDK